MWVAFEDYEDGKVRCEIKVGNLPTALADRLRLLRQSESGNSLADTGIVPYLPL